MPLRAKRAGHCIPWAISQPTGCWRLACPSGLGDVKADALAFLQGFEAIHVDCGEVRKQVFATIIRVMKPKPLRR